MTRLDFGAGTAALAISTKTRGPAKAASAMDESPIRRRGVGLRVLRAYRYSEKEIARARMA